MPKIWTAKLFTRGRSQAVGLPKKFRMSGVAEFSLVPHLRMDK